MPHVDEPTAAQLRLVVLRLARRLRQHANLDITPSQLSALTTIARWGRLRLGELAERERVSRSTVTRLVTRLEELQCVTRTPDPTDGRSAYVELSEEGERMLAASMRRADDYLADRLAALAEEDAAAILQSTPAFERLLDLRS